MATFWFISAPLPGHLDWGGFLPTAKTLLTRGHQVKWLSQTEIGGLVESAGVPLVPIAHTGWLWPPPPAPDLSSLKPTEAMFLRYRRALDTWLSEDLVPPAVDSIVALASNGKPDVLVTDPFLSAAAIAAEVIDVPLAVCGWPAGPPLEDSQLLGIQSELGRVSRERIERLLARFSARGLNFSTGATPSVQSPHLHISYFSRTWHQADSDFLPQTQFVGGKAQPPEGDAPAWLSDIANDAALALITLGSTFTGDLGFFSWAAQAAARLGLIPVVVIGTLPFTP